MRARTATVLIGVVFATTAVHAAMQIAGNSGNASSRNPPSSDRPLRLALRRLAAVTRTTTPVPGQRDEEELLRTLRTHPRAAATYRTLCVRLCDGFYFPISFATSRGKFGDDAERCERQCPGRSRLYAYRNPGEGIEQMLDLNGEPYTGLPAAFRFQSSYDPQCTCHGNPWDAESIARHQAYPPTQQPAETVAGTEQKRTGEHRHLAQPLVGLSRAAERE